MLNAAKSGYERCSKRFCGIIFPNIFLRVRWDVGYILTNETTLSSPALPALKPGYFDPTSGTYVGK